MTVSSVSPAPAHYYTTQLASSDGSGTVAHVQQSQQAQQFSHLLDQTGGGHDSHEAIGRLILAIRVLAQKPSLDHSDVVLLRAATEKLTIALQSAGVFAQGTDAVNEQDVNANLLTDDLRVSAQRLQIRTTAGRDAGWNALSEAAPAQLQNAATGLVQLALGAAGADQATIAAISGEWVIPPPSVREWMQHIHVKGPDEHGEVNRVNELRQSITEFNEWSARFKSGINPSQGDLLQYEQAGMRAAKVMLGLNPHADNNRALYAAYKWVNAQSMQELDYQRFATGGNDRQDLGLYGSVGERGYLFRQAWLNTTRTDRIAQLGFDANTWERAEQLVGTSFVAHRVRNEKEFDVGDAAKIAVAVMIGAASAGVAAGATGAAVGGASTAGTGSAAAATASGTASGTVASGVAAKAAVAFARSVAQTFVMADGDLGVAVDSGLESAVVNIATQGWGSVSAKVVDVQTFATQMAFNGAMAQLRGGDFKDGALGYALQYAGGYVGAQSGDANAADWQQRLTYNVVSSLVASEGNEGAFLASLVGATTTDQLEGSLSAYDAQFLNANPYDSMLDTAHTGGVAQASLELDWLSDVVARLDGYQARAARTTV